MLHWFEHRQVYHPDPLLRASAAQLGRPFRDLWLRTADALDLNAWFFPAPANSPRRALALLLCHGNGGNISYNLLLYQALLGHGLNLLVFDYRGYGLSHGHPSEPGTYADAQAAYRWLRSNSFAPCHILAYGESLGGGVAAELASREPLAGLILQSTFTSIPDLASELFPWLPTRWLASIHYDTIRTLRRLPLPLLLMHSRDDRLIPFHHAQSNFAAANPPKLLREIHGGHNDPLADPLAFAAALDTFLRLLDTTPPHTPAP